MEDQVHVRCPHCQQTIAVPRGAEGETTCPSCSGKMMLRRQDAPAPPPGGFPAWAPQGPPTGGFGPSAPQGPGAAERVTPGMIQNLAGTRPWVLFLSILGFIGCGIQFIAGLALLAIGSSSRRGGPPPWLGLVYIVCGVLYLIPLIYLCKYGTAIGRFLSTRRSADMEEALGAQKSFWRIMGIFTIVMLCLGLLFALFGFLAASGGFFR